MAKKNGQLRGVGFPDTNERQTVAGTNATKPNALPGIPAGPIDGIWPATQVGGVDIDVDARGFPMVGGSGQPQVYSKKLIRRFNVDLSVSRIRQKIKVSGSFIWVPDASSDTAVCEVQLDVIDNDPIPIKNGTIISGIPFEKVFLSNAAQPGESLAVVVIQDSPGDRILAQ